MGSLPLVAWAPPPSSVSDGTTGPGRRVGAWRAVGGRAAARTRRRAPSLILPVGVRFERERSYRRLVGRRYRRRGLPRPSTADGTPNWVHGSLAISEPKASVPQFGRDGRSIPLRPFDAEVRRRVVPRSFKQAAPPPSIDPGLGRWSIHRWSNRGRPSFARVAIGPNPPVPLVDRILAAAREHQLTRGRYIGCGNGRSFVPLVRAGLELEGIAVSPTAIRQLTERLPGSRGRLHVGDTASLPAGSRFRSSSGSRSSSTATPQRAARRSAGPRRSSSQGDCSASA